MYSHHKPYRSVLFCGCPAQICLNWWFMYKWLASDKNVTHLSSKTAHMDTLMRMLESFVSPTFKKISHSYERAQIKMDVLEANECITFCSEEQQTVHKLCMSMWSDAFAVFTADIVRKKEARSEHEYWQKATFLTFLIQVAWLQIRYASNLGLHLKSDFFLCVSTQSGKRQICVPLGQKNPIWVTLHLMIWSKCNEKHISRNKTKKDSPQISFWTELNRKVYMYNANNITMRTSKTLKHPKSSLHPFTA